MTRNRRHKDRWHSAANQDTWESGAAQHTATHMLLVPGKVPGHEPASIWGCSRDIYSGLLPPQLHFQPRPEPSSQIGMSNSDCDLSQRGIFAADSVKSSSDAASDLRDTGTELACSRLSYSRYDLLALFTLLPCRIREHLFHKYL